MTYYVVGKTEVVEFDGIDELVGMASESMDDIDYVIDGTIVSDTTIKERWEANNL